MATIQVRIDDSIKSEADSLFSALGLDTSTAVRMFIAASIEKRGIPFAVEKTKKNSRWTEEYSNAVMGFCDMPDPTFIPQPEPGITDRGELFV